MKKIVILSIISLLFISCSRSKEPNPGYIQTSSPIFIKYIPLNKKIFVNFTNTSNTDSNLTKIVRFNLAKQGYRVVGQQEMANIIIKGNLNFFRKIPISNFDNSGVSFGFGFGSWSNRLGFGFDTYPYDIYTDFVYAAQLSLMIEIKNGVNPEYYETNINYQSPKGWDSQKEVKGLFYQKVIRQLNTYLNVN